MSVDERRVLNCGEVPSGTRRLVHPCDKRWQQLEETGEARVRYCAQCDHLVHKVANVMEARARARQGECVAVPPVVFDRVHALALARHPPGTVVVGQFDEAAFLDEVWVELEFSDSAGPIGRDSGRQWPEIGGTVPKYQGPE